MSKELPPEPWLSFLREIDEFITEETHFHCLGGFVVTLIYGAARTTSDIDSIATIQKDPRLIEYAGLGSVLFKRYNVYFDPVGVAQLPEYYEDRLTEIFPETFDRLRLFALDPYDIALTKIERNIERDRDDVELYGFWPGDEPAIKPAAYDEVTWAEPLPPVEALERVLWERMRRLRKNRTVGCARDAGWLFSGNLPDPDV